MLHNGQIFKQIPIALNAILYGFEISLVDQKSFEKLIIDIYPLILFKSKEFLIQNRLNQNELISIQMINQTENFICLYKALTLNDFN